MANTNDMLRRVMFAKNWVKLIKDDVRQLRLLGYGSVGQVNDIDSLSDQLINLLDELNTDIRTVGRKI